MNKLTKTKSLVGNDYDSWSDDSEMEEIDEMNQNLYEPANAVDHHHA
jgi:hypothetical protein